MLMNTGILILLSTGLLVAVLVDLRDHRIPNWLILCLVLGAGILHFWSSAWGGLFASALGLVSGLLCFLPFYIFGAMGAGDVKLLAAIGALLGPSSVISVAFMTIMAGGALALAYVTARGGLPAMLKRYASMFWLMLARQPTYIPPAPGEAAGLRFPYALAIACGTALAVI